MILIITIITIIMSIITIKEYGLELGDVHAIGFSYGAHVVGHYQRNLKHNHHHHYDNQFTKIIN